VTLPPADVLRVEWALTPGLRYLNHGGFGGTPRVVREAAEAIRAEADANPTHFLTRTYWERLHRARRQIAAFLHADADGLVFVPNATAGIATVLLAMQLTADDEIVTTDHCYGAVRVALRQTGATIREATVPLDCTEDDEVVAAILAETSQRTRAIVVDHVASSSGFAFPVAAIVEAAHARGIEVCIDAAHSLAMLDVDVTALGADYWVGNLHKWLCGPRSAAVVVAASQHREALRPLIPSHLYDDGLLLAFDWTGTFDPAPVLAAPTAVDWLTTLGWDAIRERQRALAAEGAAVVAEALGTRVPVIDRFASALRVADLPQPLTFDQARAVEQRLHDAGIEVPITSMGGEWRLIRVSGAIYNQPSDYEALAAALSSVLAGAT
jgi:isopenicillin-N epimerase